MGLERAGHAAPFSPGCEIATCLPSRSVGGHLPTSLRNRERGAREPTVTKYSNLTALYPPQEYTHSARTVEQLVETAKAAGLQDETEQRW